MYLGINVLFTVRLRRVLAKDGVKTTFGKTLLAQYAGMLTSDVTPGRSGYILTPVYLRDQNVPSSKGLSSILGIQTIEFLVKVAGGVGALIYLVQIVPTATWDNFPTNCRNKPGFTRSWFGHRINAFGRNNTGAFHMVKTCYITI